ncbi:MAG: hypothetical protein IBX64_09805 [Actinobacteria bacterium]|nr:hypothetical protein [Actinomycetota bacterium]
MSSVLLSIATLLKDEFNLVVKHITVNDSENGDWSYLTSDSEKKLNDWMKDNLEFGYYQFEGDYTAK